MVFSGGTPPPHVSVDWEGVNEIRQAGFGLMEAFGQVWKTGSAAQRKKALTVINDARARSST